MQDFKQKLAKCFVYFYLNREINEIYRKKRRIYFKKIIDNGVKILIIKLS